ncbi:MAG: type II toxin-antitoxin system VapC family toxin [Chloroflexi bacterium]|nr:type II toxin-antitoxin system VapC family toxin [Chloroflexota bacterium]
MKYLLDTNICIYLIKRKPPQVLQKFQAHPAGEIGISAITVAELQFGVQKSQYVEQNQRALQQFLLPLVCAPFDVRAADAYGEIRATLESQGTPIGSLDTLIAAHALSLDATLVTNNLREFSLVPDLQVVNWVND